jgi:hypothetical protein
MDTMQYMLTAGVCLALSHLAFKIIFKNRTDFSRQRLFIISSLMMSLALAFNRFSLVLPLLRGTTTEIPFEGSFVTEGIRTLPGYPADPGFLSSVPGYLAKGYLIIASVLILILLIQLLRILFLYSVSARMKNGSIIVLSSSRIRTPFSFFNLVFIPEDINVAAERESIIIHESIHASQYHSLDNLLIEFLAAVMWFNPFIWMIRRSMYLVHEYLADEGTLGSGIDRVRYQALLINQVAEERLISLSSDFNNKLLKKRIIMMTNFKQKKDGFSRLSAMLPLTLLMFLSISVLNGFFPPEIKASDPDGFTITRTEPMTLDQELVQQDTSAFSKIKVIGYADKESQIREEKNSSLQDTTGTTRIRVIGYGKEKAESGNNSVRIERRAGDGPADSPVFVVDGVHRDGIDDLDPEEISSVEVHKEDNLIIVRTKSFAGSKSRNDQVMMVPDSPSENILYVIDGEESDKEVVEQLNPSEIESITVLKNKEAVNIYTSEDVDGVIIINTKEGNK